MAIHEQKDRMRTLAFKRRAAAARADDGTSATRLAYRVLEYLGQRVAGVTVSAFLPIRTEIETRPLIDALIKADATVVLPTIVGDSPDLVFRSWTPGEPLAKGAFDVEEPLRDAPVLDPSILIVPLLAFDRMGYRLGYGGGYYDRAIERLNKSSTVHAIGIAYDDQEVVHVPREAHDARLNAIITPVRTLEFESP